MKIGIGVLTRAGLSIMPIIVRLHWFPYCWSRVLSHAFCLHQDVIKLACGDTTFNRLYPVVVVFAMGLLDCLMIFFSCILILKTVMGIASRERAKALKYTCLPYLLHLGLLYHCGWSDIYS
jgi:olfactory receptor